MTQTLTTARQQFEEWWHEEYCHLEGSNEAAFVKHVAWEAMQKARELLANREAQPVAEIRAMPVGNGWKRQAIYWFGKQDCDLPVGMKLYTAPPAPAVNIAPDFEAWFNSPEAGFRVVNFHIQHELQLKAWNACRAAMLDGTFICEGTIEPVSPGYKFGEWISCKDRLPEEGENIITLNNRGGVWGGYVFKHGVFVDAEEEYRQDDSITHWMPLPAAPEVGNDE
ncbi:DUF551 domain-containing protein [Serratia liquefaciens]|nr:DUF551 domain-containing protein [Serratia liquefaciens]